MPGAPSSRRFAQAAFQIASEGEKLSEWRQDLATMAQAMRESGLSALLDSPQVPLDRKLSVIDEVLGEGVDPLARNLAGLLASRNAAGTIPDIADHFDRMLDAHRGVVRAEVTTAVELGQEQIDRLARTLGEAVGADVVVGTRVDPEVIGGVVARVDDRLIDGSVRTRLQEMKRELSR